MRTLDFYPIPVPGLIPKVGVGWLGREDQYLKPSNYCVIGEKLANSSRWEVVTRSSGMATLAVLWLCWWTVSAALEASTSLISQSWIFLPFPLLSCFIFTQKVENWSSSALYVFLIAHLLETDSTGFMASASCSWVETHACAWVWGRGRKILWDYIHPCA